MSTAETNTDFFEVGDKTSLICTDPELGELIRPTLRELGFKFHTVDNCEAALEHIRYTPYDIILIQDSFDGTSMRTNPVLGFVCPMTMSQRRVSMVVLIGSAFKTLDAMQAFAHSVQLVVNTSDLTNLTAILKKGWAEFEALYRVYKSVVESMAE